MKGGIYAYLGDIRTNITEVNHTGGGVSVFRLHVRKGWRGLEGEEWVGGNGGKERQRGAGRGGWGGAKEGRTKVGFALSIFSVLFYEICAGPSEILPVYR